MIKLKGKEYPVSCIKLHLDDRVCDMLDDLTKVFKQPTNKHTIMALIVEKHAQMTKQLLEAKKVSEETKEDKS